jgi:hypothetical protein
VRDDWEKVGRPKGDVREMPLDAKTFFESFYKASVRGTPDDRATIASVTDVEVRFHYNAVENSILRAFARREPLPEGPAVEAWRALRMRRGLRLLDVGAGAGHWVDFFRAALLVRDVVAVEIAENMASHLETRYAGDASVRVLRTDVSEPGFGADAAGGLFDYVSAIGVMFHIVDDERWRRATANLASVLKPGALLFVGGEFGPETRNVQFHRSDRFANWREFATAEVAEGEIRVNKRVRSLAAWTALAHEVGLEVVDLVRSDREPGIATPENDLLVLAKPRAPAGRGERTA